MKKSLSLLAVALLGSFVSLAVPQIPSGHRFPTPPEGQNHEDTDQPQTLPAHRIDFTQVQKEADDLARAADSIPSDVASVRPPRNAAQGHDREIEGDRKTVQAPAQRTQSLVLGRAPQILAMSSRKSLSTGTPWRAAHPSHSRPIPGPSARSCHSLHARSRLSCRWANPDRRSECW